MVLEKRIEEKLVRYEVEINIYAMEAEMQERYRAVVPEKASYLRKQKMCKAEIERELAEAQQQLAQAGEQGNPILSETIAKLLKMKQVVDMRPVGLAREQDKREIAMQLIEQEDNDKK